MAFISDTLLILGAFCLAIYCLILSRRLNRFGNLESEIGTVITGLSTQIDTLSKSIQKANESGEKSVKSLRAETIKAEAAARHLELLVASLHTLPKAKAAKQENPFFVRQNIAKAVQS